jgi:4-diphosphocytidyl-2-C-methyl-D-erythritol kinase
MKTAKLKAPAKINLTLEIMRKLPNGFHELRSVFAKLPNLYDEISVNFYPERKGIFLKSRNKKIPLNENNICFKAVKKFFETTGKSIGISIEIKKNIPIGAGLGGGSSDGAAILKILNQYFRHPLSEKKLIKMASEIGKDIPFFFSQKRAALIEGAGEKIGKVFEIGKINFLLINPNVYVGTKEAYEILSPIISKMKNRKNFSKEIILALKKGKIDCVSGCLYNDFELVMEKKHPIISELKNKLIELGASGALMSGSGSTVFGIFESRKKILEAEKKMKKYYPKFLVKIG